MTEDRTPWWYSGDEPERPASDDSAEAGPPSPALDWMGLLAGAARMVDWATSTVLTPHAEHVDPAANPQCLVCRAMLVVGDRSVSPPPLSEPAVTPQVRWIPVVDDPADAGS